MEQAFFFSLMLVPESRKEMPMKVEGWSLMDILAVGLNVEVVPWPLRILARPANTQCQFTIHF